MIKFIKKAVSALLASVMCIPAGVVNIASAEENDTNTVTTVTLSDTENGLMQFSQECMDASTANQDGFHMVQVNEDGELDQVENDGSIWAFSAGNQVEVELLPDEDYNVKSFTIKSADTGEIMAHAEGKYIKGTTTFTPDNADGTTEVVFTFNAEGMEETDLVVFEEIFYQEDLYERKSVAEHSGLMDEEQSVSIPKIKTDMLDAKTGLKLANAEASSKMKPLKEEDMVLHDTVRYSGLIFQKNLILNDII